MSQICKVNLTEHLTHDVLRIQADKPEGLTFQPGQAADISINKPGWENELRPFTFTSLPEENFLEFIIKTYPSHKGVTNQLLSIEKGDELIIHKPFGDIHYQGEGIFIAGGAGVTPFIAILRDLERQSKVGNNKLIFANKTRSDIIREDKFRELLGDNFVNVLSEEELEGYEHGYISEELIRKHTGEQLKYFYLCGPPPMMDAVENHFASLGIGEEFIIKEGF